MSTIRTVNIQHPSSSTPSITMDSTGAMTGNFPYPNRNLLYNGAMQVHQRSTSIASITGTGFNTADRWAVQIDTCGTWTQSIENDAPTGSGFRKSFKMLVTTSATPAASKYAFIYQPLEGQDLQRIAKGTASAQPLTLSFWVKGNVTGTYIVQLNDNDNAGRSIQQSYTINQSATWEKKTVVFPADLIGVLDNDNALSLYLRFWLAAGTDFTSGTLSTSSWTTTFANWCVGQINLTAATNNYIQITGVQLETGSVATPFEFKSYGQDLRECQRYYWRSTGGQLYSKYSTGYAWNTTNSSFTLVNPVNMRVAPTAVESSNLGITIESTSTTATTAVTLNVAGVGPYASAATTTVTSGLTANRPYDLTNNNNTAGYIAFSAEL